MSDEAPRLTRGGRRLLGALAGSPVARLTVVEAILVRGGGGQMLRELATHLHRRRVWEVANQAAQGDKEAERAIKAVKGARRLGQRY